MSQSPTHDYPSAPLEKPPKSPLHFTSSFVGSLSGSSGSSPAITGHPSGSACPTASETPLMEQIQALKEDIQLMRDQRLSIAEQARSLAEGFCSLNRYFISNGKDSPALNELRLRDMLRRAQSVLAVTARVTEGYTPEQFHLAWRRAITKRATSTADEDRMAVAQDLIPASQRTANISKVFDSPEAFRLVVTLSPNLRVFGNEAARSGSLPRDSERLGPDRADADQDSLAILREVVNSLS
ncbi:hypothetical protein FA95DRAFT_1606557 [Auriscalpium vulgare]|uniref:Uncharacterized protein n=1 Tax=Auriscalpium vulgare TaxID=40419 RepID=A0ACB8RRN7_9AGAM|nr:hypothetical protein FA95DRAFT_1606557 [Auriscalpium vulgare]